MYDPDVFSALSTESIAQLILGELNADLCLTAIRLDFDLLPILLNIEGYVVEQGACFIVLSVCMLVKRRKVCIIVIILALRRDLCHNELGSYRKRSFLIETHLDGFSAVFIIVDFACFC